MEYVDVTDGVWNIEVRDLGMDGLRILGYWFADIGILVCGY